MTKLTRKAENRLIALTDEYANCDPDDTRLIGIIAEVAVIRDCELDEANDWLTEGADSPRGANGCAR